MIHNVYNHSINLICFRYPDGGKGSIPWKQFTTTDRNYINFDVPITSETFLSSENVKLWTEIFEKVEYQAADDNANHDEL